MVRENGRDSDLPWLTEHWTDIPEPTRKQMITAARDALNLGGASR
ncbi:MAG: hypothetical protein ACYST6_12705 [Planctomycetota bacterium]|jgi:hypothetical protein